ncbi:MAG: LCP family protein [Nodosilinea sp.]
MESTSGSPSRLQSPSLNPVSPTSTSGRRLPRGLRRFLWGTVFAGTALSSALIGAFGALLLPLPSSLGPAGSPLAGIGDLWKAGFRYQITRPVNILVMGIDEVPGVNSQSEQAFAGRTDTLLLVHLNPQGNSLNVVSIPRDTRVQIPGYGMAKINQANVEGGPGLVAQTINYNLGNVQIDRYVRVNTAAFREIVDLLGGVEINVPKRMQYHDSTQNLNIDLYPGWQTLSGDQAEQFARFRKDNAGDIGRVQRQQMLLKALRDRLMNPVVITKLPQAIRVIQRYVNTNLSTEEMLALANVGLAIKPDQLQMVMLPGRFSQPSEFRASYWLPDWTVSAKILQNFLQADGVSIYASNSSIPQTTDLNIAIQNASGDPKVGAAVASYLHKSGFHRVYLVEDWSTPLQNTQVVAQKGDLEAAKTLQALLPSGRVVSESTGDLQSDITIRVGRDWIK